MVEMNYFHGKIQLFLEFTRNVKIKISVEALVLKFSFFIFQLQKHPSQWFFKSEILLGLLDLSFKPVLSWKLKKISFDFLHPKVWFLGLGLFYKQKSSLIVGTFSKNQFYHVIKNLVSFYFLLNIFGPFRLSFYISSWQYTTFIGTPCILLNVVVQEYRAICSAWGL